MIEVASLPRSAPEAQGIPSSAILSFLDAVEAADLDLHGLLLLRHGAVVAEGYWAPYTAADPHTLQSLSKSFTSTGIGLLVAEGKLTVEDKVLDLLPDVAPANPDARLRALSVHHLLTMTTGHDPDPTRLVREGGEVSWMRAFFAVPLVHEPGTYFVYNTVATYMLSAIVQRLSGQRLLDYLGPRLFEPLGIAPPTWEVSPEGINTGGWGLSLRTRDIARFGQMILQGGVWQGKRVLPAEWVAEATRRQVPTIDKTGLDWLQGYGYQFWRCRHDVFRGDGMWGQFCAVMPRQEAVLATTAGVSDMQAVLDLVWERLLPALGDAPLAADPAAETALRTRLAELGTVPVRAESPLAAGFSGREYALLANPEGRKSIEFDFRANGGAVTIVSESGAQRLAFGNGHWTRNNVGALGESSPLRPGERFVPAGLAACGGWTDERTFVLDLCWYRSPFRRRLTCHFEGDLILINQRVNVPAGPTEVSGLVGRAK